MEHTSYGTVRYDDTVQEYFIVSLSVLGTQYIRTVVPKSLHMKQSGYESLLT